MGNNLKIGSDIYEGISIVQIPDENGIVVPFSVNSDDGETSVAGSIMNCSLFASGTYSDTINVALADLEITVGFKPKVFFIHIIGAVYTGLDTSPYTLTGSFSLYNDEYVAQLQYSTFLLKGDSTNGWARAGASNGNGFYATDTGVKGFGTDVKALKNVTYKWYAWG